MSSKSRRPRPKGTRKCSPGPHGRGVAIKALDGPPRPPETD